MVVKLFAGRPHKAVDHRSSQQAYSGGSFTTSNRWHHIAYQSNRLTVMLLEVRLTCGPAVTVLDSKIKILGVHKFCVKMPGKLLIPYTVSAYPAVMGYLVEQKKLNCNDWP